MIALHLFLAHAVADYSFTNPMKLYGMIQTSQRLKHFCWVILVFLAFTFDITLTSFPGALILCGGLAIHFLTDLFRWKKQNPWIVELISLGAFLLYGMIVSSFFADSFLSPYFSTYLIGMVAVSVLPTQVFRMMGGLQAMDNESDGISERLAMFIFGIAQQYLFLAIAIGAALVYRILFRKKPNWVWVASPLIGLFVSLIFRWIIFS